jgi:hypothetical protein
MTSVSTRFGCAQFFNKRSAIPICSDGCAYLYNVLDFQYVALVFRQKYYEHWRYLAIPDGSLDVVAEV